MPHPWEVGDERQRWVGYLDERYPDPEAGTYVLRNKVGATTYEQLSEREDQAVNLRATTLRDHGIPATYDLEGLRDIHRHLFQDVYEGAGDVRAVDIAKGPFFARSSLSTGRGPIWSPQPRTRASSPSPSRPHSPR